MNKDARVDVGFPEHPKTVRLQRTLGDAGPWALVRLWLWAAKYRPDGNLAGLHDDELEAGIRWSGKSGQLLLTLRSIGFVDGPELASQLHDWTVHNLWAFDAPERTKNARWAGLVRQHGEAKARKVLAREARAQRHRAAQQGGEQPGQLFAIAPSPAPTPAPTPMGTDSKARANGTRLPEDWQPTEDLINEARAILNGYRLDLVAETAKFRDHWHAQPGARGRKADWDATFRNWIRRSITLPVGAHRHDAAPARRPSLAEQAERDLELLERREAESH